MTKRWGPSLEEYQEQQFKPCGNITEPSWMNTKEKAVKNQPKQQEYWREQSERAVDPKHYKGYFKEHQWVDTMREITPLKMGDRFRGALEFTVRGYLDRCGQKDDELQELNKALFYFMYLVKYVEGAKFDAESIHKWRNAHVELDT
jgi:hypothetical protein